MYVKATSTVCVQVYLFRALSCVCVEENVLSTVSERINGSWSNQCWSICDRFFIRYRNVFDFVSLWKACFILISYQQPLFHMFRKCFGLFFFFFVLKFIG